VSWSRFLLEPVAIFGSIAMMKQRITPRSEIVEMEGYHSPQVNVRVRLNTNESPFAPPIAWQELLADDVASIEFHRYPDRSARQLRTAIGALHGVGPEQIFVANGSNEVLQTLCLTYGGSGRSAVTFEPTYALHSHIARISGATVHSYDRRADFSLDPEVVANAIRLHQPELLFLCSPNNPTGLCEPRELIESCVEDAPGIVIVDEAYGQFAPRSAIELVNDQRDVVVVRTYSKTWAMAAARLGYLVGPAAIVAELEKVVLPYHLDAMKQSAGLLALRFEHEMRARVEQLVAERNRVTAALRTLPIDVWDSASNFILFRPQNHDANVVWQGLVDRSVLVRNCASWPRLEGCLRVTIGTPEEDDLFLAALAEVLA
jgi:histidinol-phosphate aminotransferase